MHFKACLLDDVAAAQSDRSSLEKLYEKIDHAEAILADDENLEFLSPDSQEEPTSDNTKDQNTRDDEFAGNLTEAGYLSHTKTHRTLKQLCVTRWNSALIMLQSINDLKDTVNESLKRTGNMELCLNAREEDLIKALLKFLEPFEGLTKVVSMGNCSLSLLPMIREDILDRCKTRGFAERRASQGACGPAPVIRSG